MQIPIGCSVCKNNTARIITDPESGEIVCNSCGIVISDKIQDITPTRTTRFQLKKLIIKAEQELLHP
jgi:transcription initiation factor TFIIIB Brf1 subunit/transcription initiation factor TFIIB